MVDSGLDQMHWAAGSDRDLEGGDDDFEPWLAAIDAPGRYTAMSRQGLEGDELDTMEASAEEVFSEGSDLDFGEGGVAPSEEYRERLRRRRGEKPRRQPPALCNVRELNGEAFSLRHQRA